MSSIHPNGVRLGPPAAASVHSMSGRRVFFAAGLATVALAAAGCGGDDEASSSERWAGDVCSSVSSWQESIQSATDSLGAGGGTDAVEAAVEDITEATRTLADDLETLGAPETEAGAEAAELVETLSDDLAGAVDDVEEALEGVDDASGALAAASAVAAVLTTVGTQVSSIVGELQQLDARGELGDAFDQADSCEELREDR
jgi:hypothetical protein